MDSDSILSERTLREIYLKGFEIAIKESQPMSIMTSYNLINGVHAANCNDICTKAARCEWGFEGMIMTDWTTTEKGPVCTASGYAVSNGTCGSGRITFVRGDLCGCVCVSAEVQERT